MRLIPVTAVRHLMSFYTRRTTKIPAPVLRLVHILSRGAHV
jgi:hypothetical protein